MKKLSPFHPRLKNRRILVLSLLIFALASLGIATSYAQEGRTAVPNPLIDKLLATTAQVPTTPKPASVAVSLAPPTTELILIEGQEPPVTKNEAAGESHESLDPDDIEEREFFTVVRVIDGDTIDVLINGTTARIRLIGVNTPETVDPRKTVECFGTEASAFTKSLLTGVKVSLEADPSQADRDKYGRLLRYVFLEDDTNVAEYLISQGYAHEYTYGVPYTYQLAFKTAEREARQAERGLWDPQACGGEKESESDCVIKGNIAASGEKIYHVPGGAYYGKTAIDMGKGERWFCSEDEALAAGWRKSKV